MKETKENGFKGYSKLTNHYSNKFMKFLHRHNLVEGLWIALEKLHGANFQMEYFHETGEIRVGSRNMFIGNDDGRVNETAQYPITTEILALIVKVNEGETLSKEDATKLRTVMESLTFYHCHLVVRKYANELVRFATTEFPNQNVTLYGELFGGKYEDMESQGSNVMKEIQYTNDTEFGIFDMVVDEVLLPYDEVLSHLHGYKFFTIPIERTGTLEELLNMENTFNTNIPKYLNEFNGFSEGDEGYLKPIEGENICEGLVLKPLDSSKFFLPSGDRVSLKFKNEKFAEKKGQSGKKKNVKEVKPLAEHLQSLNDELIQYPTKQRFDNVLSKFTNEVTFKEFPTLLNLMSTDCFEEFEKEANEDLVTAYKSLNKKDAKSMVKIVGGLCSEIIRDYLKRNC